MSKKCSNRECTESDPLFHKNKNTPDGLSYWCKSCVKTWACRSKERLQLYHRQRFQNNREIMLRQRKTYHRKRHGLSNVQFDALLEKQNGQCAICQETSPGGTGEWHIDHDHSCCSGFYSCGRCIRGLLCSRCNRGLGFMKDSVDLLHNAVQYLNKGVLAI